MRLWMNLLLLFSFSVATATGSIGSSAFAELSACGPLTEARAVQDFDLQEGASAQQVSNFKFLENAELSSVQVGQLQNMQLSEAVDHEGSDACPIDCHCPAHFACSGHFTLFVPRAHPASTSQPEDAVKYPRLHSRVTPSPYLEGPFQPPKV